MKQLHYHLSPLFFTAPHSICYLLTLYYIPNCLYICYYLLTANPSPLHLFTPVSTQHRTSSGHLVSSINSVPVE